LSSSLHTNEAARVNFTRLGLETSVETSSSPFMEGIALPHTQKSGWTGLSPCHESTRFVTPTWECPGASPAQDSSDTHLQEAVQKQIEVLLRGTEREAQHIKEEAYAAGFATGEEQGFEAGQQRLQATLEHLGQALQEVGRLRSQLFAQSERELLELSLAIARQVLHHEASVNRDGVLSLIRAGIKRVSQRQELRIKVHPDDFLCTVSYKARS
jgi:flagellar biosynthesis/type III secretory pathway protein FliH